MMQALAPELCEQQSDSNMVDKGTGIMKLKREFKAEPLHNEESGAVEGYVCLVCAYKLGYRNKRDLRVWSTRGDAELHIARDHGESLQ